MIDVVMNPVHIEGLYLECLNMCFGDWGGPAMYNWCFERRLGGRKPDIMLLKEKEKVLGGSAVTYRHALLNNAIVPVAIMTGSWTLQEARNQGCFTIIIEESLKLARDAGAALLIAFVTQTNPSLKRLMNRGSALFPTHYLVTGKATPQPGSPVELNVMSDVARCSVDMSRFTASGTRGCLRFAYSPEEWRSQFIERAEVMEYLCVDGNCVGMLEKKGPFDRLLAFAGHEPHSPEDILRTCCARSVENHRRLFFFTASSLLKDYGVKLGFEHIPGYLTTLIAGEEILRGTYTKTPSGTPAPADIYDPTSPWYIGEWHLTAGDRM
jgi:hypothetical protein